MTFSNSILAGEELVRTAIRSSNYVAGVSGWRIDRLGNAEFNGGTFRGALVVTGPNGSLVIYNDPTFGVVILFTDPSGYQWRERATLSGTVHSFAIEAVVGNPSFGMTYDSSTGASLVGFIADEFAVVASARSDFPGETHVGSNGNFYDAEAWQNAGLLNGWANTGGFQPPASYRRRGRAVDIRGVIQSGTLNLPAFQMPAAYRPSFNQVYGVYGSGAVLCQLVVSAATGNVTLVNGTTSATAINVVVPID